MYESPVLRRIMGVGLGRAVPSMKPRFFTFVVCWSSRVGIEEMSENKRIVHGFLMYRPYRVRYES